MPDPARPESRTITSGRLRLAGLIAVIVAGAIVTAGMVSRVNADQDLKAFSREQAVPTVALAKMSEGGERQLILPAEVQAQNNAAIHARVSGYLKRLHADIGDRVKAGQVLAEIDTPELDQQVLQARADLATAQANEALAASTAKRWAALVAREVVSRQAGEEKAGDLVAKTSVANSQRANLNRLLALTSFKQIRAPFEGVVTSRATDIGALITVGGAADSTLFTVADLRRLRIYARVPQSYSALVRPGLLADVTAPEYPGETFHATVVADAGAVSAQTGAVLTELRLDNADGRLKAGGYAQVTFNLAAGPTAIRLPATALLYRNSVPTLALVGPDNRVKLRQVTINRDMGATVEIGAGLTRSDRVADNPPEAVADGDLVRVAAPKPKGSVGVAD